MFGIALRGVKNSVGRYVATRVAFIVGVSFFAATGFLSARIIDSLEGDANRQFGNVDVAVVPKDNSNDFAKSLVWQQDFEALKNQYQIAQRQFEMLQLLDGQVQYLVTECSLPQLLYYNEQY